ncbi:MAG: sensor histidine kinase [Anaerolineaceae bacterium]|jgi:signal transduction histidine kinase
MESPTRSSIKTGSGVDLAFAVVVLASYFATFSAMDSATLPQIFLMISLGTAYILVGIYGYAYCSRSNTLILKLTYFLVQILIGCSIIYLGKGAGLNALVLLPLAGHSVMLLSADWMYATNGLVVASYMLTMRILNQSWSSVWSGLPIFLAGQVFIVVFTQMAVDEEKARMEVERLAVELTKANQQLREYALQVEDLTITKERNRLAREIHDGLGHYLTIVHMQIQAARAILTANPERARDALDSAQNLTQEALVDVRRSVAALRAAPEDNLPLPDRITKMLKSCDTVGISSDLRVIGKVRSLTPQTELTLYRAAQEGLNNTCKHAQASQIWITLDYSGEEYVRLTVRDDGMGAENTEGGFGLLGLQERVNLLNGELKTTSSFGQGFDLEIKVPG